MPIRILLARHCNSGVVIALPLPNATRSSGSIRSVTAASTESLYVIELIEPASEACPATVRTANVGVGPKGIVENIVFKIERLSRAEIFRAGPRIISPISDALPRTITQVQKNKDN